MSAELEDFASNHWYSNSIMFSKTCPGVSFVLLHMTFGRRLELMRRVRDLAARLEYFEAGRDAKNEMEAGLLGAEIDRLYVVWGIDQILGLRLDGKLATVETLIERGPEELFLEMLAAVRAECALSETERKN